MSKQPTIEDIKKYQIVCTSCKHSRETLKSDIEKDLLRELMKWKEVAEYINGSFYCKHYNVVLWKDGGDEEICEHYEKAPRDAQ